MLFFPLVAWLELFRPISVILCIKREKKQLNNNPESFQAYPARAEGAASLAVLVVEEQEEPVPQTQRHPLRRGTATSGSCGDPQQKHTLILFSPQQGSCNLSQPFQPPGAREGCCTLLPTTQEWGDLTTTVWGLGFWFSFSKGQTKPCWCSKQNLPLPCPLASPINRLRSHSGIPASAGCFARVARPGAQLAAVRTSCGKAESDG